MKVELHQAELLEVVMMASGSEESPKLIPTGSPEQTFIFDYKIDELTTKLRVSQKLVLE